MYSQFVHEIHFVAKNMYSLVCSSLYNLTNYILKCRLTSLLLQWGISPCKPKLSYSGNLPLRNKRHVVVAHWYFHLCSHYTDWDMAILLLLDNAWTNKTYTPVYRNATHILFPKHVKYYRNLGLHVLRQYCNKQYNITKRWGVALTYQHWSAWFLGLLD